MENKLLIKSNLTDQNVYKKCECCNSILKRQFIKAHYKTKKHQKNKETYNFNKQGEIADNKAMDDEIKGIEEVRLINDNLEFDIMVQEELKDAFEYNELCLKQEQQDREDEQKAIEAQKFHDAVFN